MSPPESSPGVFLEQQGDNVAREKAVRRVALLRKRHQLSFTTLYLLSPLPCEAGREITEKTTKKR